jgi:hypothetical protein
MPKTAGKTHPHFLITGHNLLSKKDLMASCSGDNFSLKAPFYITKDGCIISFVYIRAGRTDMPD